MRYLFAVLSLLTLVNAQFGGFFDQMFNQQGGHEHHQAQQQNNPSDANHYKQNYENSICDKYLCPIPSHAFTFPTTVLALGMLNKKSSNWLKDNVSVFLVGDSDQAKQLERLNWQERDYCEQKSTTKTPRTIPEDRIWDNRKY